MKVRGGILIIWNNTIYISTTWGGGYITFGELLIDFIILFILILVGGYFTRKKWEGFLDKSKREKK